MGGWLGENAWHGAAGRRRARGYWRGLGLGGEGEGEAKARARARTYVLCVLWILPGESP